MKIQQIHVFQVSWDLPIGPIGNQSKLWEFSSASLVCLLDHTIVCRRFGTTQNEIVERHVFSCFSQSCKNTCTLGKKQDYGEWFEVFPSTLRPNFTLQPPLLNLKGPTGAMQLTTQESTRTKFPILDLPKHVSLFTLLRSNTGAQRSPTYLYSTYST